VTTVLPFGNFVEVLEITGAQLKVILEWGYDSVRPRCLLWAHLRTCCLKTVCETHVQL
jgi:hypothetical protein